MENPQSENTLIKAHEALKRIDEKSLLKDSENILIKASRILNRTETYLKTDEIVCACYLYRFREYGSKKDFHNFKKIFNNLSDEKRYQAINYYLTYAKNMREQEKKNKAKKR